MDQISIHSWIQSNSIKTESGQPLDFHTHRFLIDIYEDKSKYVVLEKAAQLGLTTAQIYLSFWIARYMKMDIIYVLPSFSDVKDFSGGKVNRIIEQNPILQGWTEDKDSVEQKRVGQSTIYYRGSWNERAALMISADMLILDEFDRSNQAVVEQYESRLQHSKHGYKRIFSNPSSSDFGVDKYYKQSDQKKWHITHSCGKTYPMEENCVDYNTEKYRCPKCLGIITSEEIRMGEWIATAQGEWSGYRIPLWVYPAIEASKICEYKRTKSPDYFANFVAGEPWAGTGNKISVQEVLKNCTSQINDQTGQIIIGVDSGLPIHYSIGNDQGLFYYGTCQNYNPIRQFMKNWPTSIVIADQGGDLIAIRELQNDFPGRVFLVYSNKQFKDDIAHWDDKNMGLVDMDRNGAVQYSVDHMREQRIPLFGSQEDWQPFAKHFSNIMRVDEETPSGVMRRVWKRYGPDHWVFSTCYYFVGINRFSGDKGGFVGGQDEYKLLEGYVDNSNPFL